MSDIKPNDGGPAFPRLGEGFGNSAYEATGMNLRDWFAGKAMEAWLSTYVSQPHHPSSLGGDYLNTIANDAYAVADAMLKAREV